MKTAILPQVRIAPELRTDLESVLCQGETLSEFVEASVRGAIEYRHMQSEFHARGELAWQEYLRAGASYPASQVIGELRDMLASRREQLQALATSGK
ncbi:hypothetical protein AGMMS49960_00720 [Betaproteobacteria bacterium]|nr:hypothetical protein AGMMS49543_06940 [Betaproteobacteria bacterium]GHT98167.1 hypothetical protein AGMMS49960_00720 [Betaproteobacteria bacterium]GHU08720.1 hypothetical protein AGMMS50225_07900 [Betaproteobacteria bacterium]GHU21174.1 hypothetical protein AGMMS50243_18160 [Betaproteobacteria bacterium]GHU25858.1 hypothetical protein FACS189488_13590 [Betaproteobacteria bacterium]